jgi:hypothetical protein
LLVPQKIRKEDKRERQIIANGNNIYLLFLESAIEYINKKNAIIYIKLRVNF